MACTRAACLIGTALLHQLAQAQFELPSRGMGNAAVTAPLVQAKNLDFQYSYGMEAPLSYRRNNDLDSALPDNALVFKGKVFGSVIYRPTPWLTTTLEGKLGREYGLAQEDPLVLPNGDIKPRKHRVPSLMVEQAFVTIRQVIAPFEIHVGRRNYEDDRHWLFDGSLDVVSLGYRHENVRAEAMVARDAWMTLDVLHKQPKLPIETTMLYADYRGFDNQVVAAYFMRREDLSNHEGRPITWGLRASGRPTSTLSYWSEFAMQRGTDENGLPLRAHALDIGATYRFDALPHDPNITLGYAYASGDRNPDDGTNTQFRQTGIQSNEARYIGLSKFKTYGEVLDTELSNLHIYTLGIGARATPGISIDVVYHRYFLDALATELRNSPLTAQMNTVPGAESKDVGQALDLVIGFRGLFGYKRFGLDLRAGLFFPGDAFRTADGSLPAPMTRRADKGLSIVAKFRY